MRPTIIQNKKRCKYCGILLNNHKLPNSLDGRINWGYHDPHSLDVCYRCEQFEDDFKEIEPYCARCNDKIPDFDRDYHARYGTFCRKCSAEITRMAYRKMGLYRPLIEVLHETLLSQESR